MEDRASSRLWGLAVIEGVKKDIKRDGWVSFFIICHCGKKTQSGIYNTTTSFLSSPSLHPCSKNNKKLSLVSVGLKPRLSLSVISTHKALSLVLYCLPILDAQTTLAYLFLPSPFIASNHPCPKKTFKKASLMLVKLKQNIKISAARSLADICFLHVLNLVFSLCFSMKCSVVT